MEMQAPGAQLMAGASEEMQIAAAKLQGLSVIKVEQQRQWIEVLSCFERQNRYIVWDGPGGAAAGAKALFFIQENSTCLERNCCPFPDCKPWRMDFHQMPAEGWNRDATPPVNPKEFPVFMHIERPCSCTYLCINRPKAFITEVPSGREIGQLTDPCACCNLTFAVNDPAGVPQLAINSCICQPGLICPCPGCEVNFPVNDAVNNTPVANLKKIWVCGDHLKCMKEWDNYQVEFGDASNSDYKMLLMTMAVFVQMRYFDSRNQE